MTNLVSLAPGESKDRSLGEISLENVTHEYLSDKGSVTQALAETNLVIDSGQFICVVGPSGCGKSTLLNILAGFVQPSGGRLLVDNEPVTGPSHERGVVFQQPNLFPWLTVAANVALGLRFRGIDKQVRRERADAFIELVGLTSAAKQRPYELSGGMQQRAQIARVLANDPSIMLMDEPFGALDAMTREKLQADLLEISRKNNTTMFFITHSVEEAIFLGDRVIVLSPRPGRIVLDIPIEISQHYGRQLGPELRSTPEFIELRDQISGALVHGR